MDYKEQYESLTQKLLKELPLKAYPIRELTQVFRNKGNPVTLKTELTISSVYNSGDISGIICIVEVDKKNVIACSLTHLLFNSSCPLFKEIIGYQKKRYKRIEQLDRMKMN